MVGRPGVVMLEADNIEQRVATEWRVAGRKLEGYAATFGSVARVGNFTETIAPGAFGGSLRSGEDIVALVDHDQTRLLARTRSGSLRLSEDDKGLAFSMDVPDTQAGRDVLALAERNDLGGMSFGFTVLQGGERWEGNQRELRSVELKEISVVSVWPAYDGTSIAARGRIDTPARVRLARLYLETV